MGVFDSVRLCIDVPRYGLKAGVLGTIVHDHGGVAFEVDVDDDNDETDTTATLYAHELELIESHPRQAPHQSLAAVSD